MSLGRNSLHSHARRHSLLRCYDRLVKQLSQPQAFQAGFVCKNNLRVQYGNVSKDVVYYENKLLFSRDVEVG